VSDAPHDQLRAQLIYPFMYQLEAQVGGRPMAPPWDQLSGPLRHQLWTQLADQLSEELDR
jgi:hypothetical protein